MEVVECAGADGRVEGAERAQGRIGQEAALEGDPLRQRVVGDALPAERDHRFRAVDTDKHRARERASEARRDVGRTAGEVDHASAGDLVKLGEPLREVGDDGLVRVGEVGFGVRDGLVGLVHQFGLGDALHSFNARAT